MARNGHIPGLYVPDRRLPAIEGRARKAKVVVQRGESGRTERVDALAVEWRFRGERAWRVVMLVPDGQEGNTIRELATVGEELSNCFANAYVKGR